MDIFSVLAPGLAPITRALQSLMPDALVLALWALPTTVLVMWLYGRLSPQQRLNQLAVQMQAAQKKMLSLQVSGEDAMAATFVYMKLSLQRMALSLLPAVLASLPAVFMMGALDVIYPSLPYDALDQAGVRLWLQQWWVLFLIYTLAFSIVFKVVLRLR